MTSAGEYEIRLGDDSVRGGARALVGTVASVETREKAGTEGSSGRREDASGETSLAPEERRDGFAIRAKARRFWDGFGWREASGAMGDLGTFIPLLVGLSIECGVDAGTTVVFTGLYNILTAFLYEIPMPVQPMKTIAAVALSESTLTTNEIMVAGIFVSSVVFTLGATRLMDVFNKVTPLAVVQGMQVGLGMLLARKGFVLAVYKDKDGKDVRDMLGVDGLLVTIIAMCVVMYVCSPEYPARRRNSVNQGELGGEQQKKRGRHYIPMALILVVVGLIMAMTRSGALSGLAFGPQTPRLITASNSEIRKGVIVAGIPQLPLTTLNSVISICALSKELFPDTPASPSSVATSVGVMNLVGCWFGAMPSCHGAGGLSAQYAFGARGGGSIVFLGVCKLFLGLLFGSSLMKLLEHFPKTILGVMLFSSSLELIGMGLKTKPGWRQHQKYLVMVTASVTIATKSTAVGFAAGIGTHILMEVQRRIEVGQQE